MAEEKEELPEPHGGMTPEEKGALLVRYVRAKQPVRREDGTPLDFAGANLRQADLQGADLQTANLWGADLLEANLRGAILQGVRLQRAKLEKANLQGTDLRQADLREADLQGADLQGADLQDANLRGANLQGADLPYTNLQRANLQDTNLQNANLWKAILQEADLREADLLGAEFRQAALQRVDLRGAILQGAKLQGAKLQRACLQGAYLQGARLQEANLQGADLEGADLQEANLWGADLHEADLQGADLQDANLQEADLQGAKLQGVRLQGADLRGAILQGSNLRQADLQRAKLQRAKLQDANLQDANLQEVILQRADFQGADLQGTDFRGADLLGVMGIPSSRRSARLSAETYIRSVWMPVSLVDWLRADAILEDFNALPPDVQEQVLTEQEGLTLRFRTRLKPFDQAMLLTVIEGFHRHQPGSDVRLVDFRERDGVTVVRLLSSNAEDLATIAEVLYSRPWEREPQEGEPPATAAPASDTTQLQVAEEVRALTNPLTLQHLSRLVSRGETFELWVFEDGKLEKKQEWTIPQDKSRALADLLSDLFDDTQLREFLRSLPQGNRIVKQLPGTVAALANVASAAVEQLQREKRITVELFLALGRERSGGQPEIASVARLWDIDLPPILDASG